ncbi:hypothetical protein C6P40_000360 [Pichia californica]|uniref:Uncharacterized protein n=1 Tax=Pichia californica TaxID=460514 RepID=A0A9P7BFG6_9ASCO|nr:hypothetical protein C6P40_000360 [[Candida] californica]
MFIQPVEYLYTMSGHQYDSNKISATISLGREILNFEGKFINTLKCNLFQMIETLFIPTLQKQIHENTSVNKDSIDLCLEHNQDCEEIFKNTIFDSNEFKKLRDKEFKSNPKEFIEKFLSDSSPLLNTAKRGVFDMRIISKLVSKLKDDAQVDGHTVKSVIELAHELNNHIKTIDINLGVSTSLSSKLNEKLLNLRLMKKIMDEKVNSLQQEHKVKLNTCMKDLNDLRREYDRSVNEVCNLNQKLVESDTQIKKLTDTLVSVTSNQQKPSNLIAGNDNCNGGVSFLKQRVIENKYTGPFYRFSNVSTFSDLYKEWNERIVPLNNIAGNAWRIESGVSLSDYYKRKNCITFIECLNKYYTDINGIELLMQYTNSEYYGNIRTVLNKLPVPKAYKDSEFQISFVAWLNKFHFKAKISPEYSQDPNYWEQLYILSGTFKD